MTIDSLPWQEITASLIGLVALVHLTRRWWPGQIRSTAASCHSGDTAPKAAASACQGGCSGCPSRQR
jgi:hypothetical protein